MKIDIDNNFSFDLPKNKSNVMKVMGVGGGGSNAVNHMFQQGITGVDFVVCNTDSQALDKSPVPNKIQLGVNLTEGLGAGANPEIGKLAAVETHEELRELLETQTKMLFITAGFGGGTGTGASPIIAEIAKELGILTGGVVTKPFDYEGPSRSEQAEAGIRKLEQHVDSLIVIPNEKLKSLGKTITVMAGFEAANNVLLNSVQGIVELITVPGVINLDFADVKAVMSDKGRGIMGSALASGPDRGRQAVDEAINSPLLEDINLEGAKGILLNVTSGKDLEISELEEIGSMVKGYASKEAKLLVGTSVSQEMNDSIRVTVVATGLEDNEKGEKKSTETNFRNFDRPITERNPLTQTKDLFGNKEEDIVESNKELEILDVPKFLKRQDA